METLKIDRTKLITQSEYAKMLGLTRSRINQKIKAGEIRTVSIKGATLIYLE